MDLFAISNFSQAPTVRPLTKSWGDPKRRHSNEFVYAGPIVVPLRVGINETAAATEGCTTARVTSDHCEFTCGGESTVRVTCGDWFSQYVCALALLFPQVELSTVRPWLCVLWALLPTEPEPAGDTKGPLEGQRTEFPSSRDIVASMFGACMKGMQMGAAQTKVKSGVTVKDYARMAGNGIALRVTTAEIPPPPGGPRRERWAERLRNFPPDLSATLELNTVFAEAGMTWEKIAEGARTFNSAEWRRKKNAPCNAN